MWRVGAFDVKGRAFLVLVAYVASLVLVACGHCAPSFGLGFTVADAEQSHHHDDADHDHSGSAEECPADMVAKGCVPARLALVDVSSAKSVAVLPAIATWPKAEPLVALAPERPPDTAPRALSGYAQTFARTGRFIV